MITKLMIQFFTNTKAIINLCLTYIGGLGVMTSYKSAYLSISENDIWATAILVFLLTLFSVIFTWGVYYFTRDIRRFWKSHLKQFYQEHKIIFYTVTLLVILGIVFAGGLIDKIL